jgi:hypothetical protein
MLKDGMIDLAFMLVIRFQVVIRCRLLEGWT